MAFPGKGRLGDLVGRPSSHASNLCKDLHARGGEAGFRPRLWQHLPNPATFYSPLGRPSSPIMPNRQTPNGTEVFYESHSPQGLPRDATALCRQRTPIGRCCRLRPLPCPHKCLPPGAHSQRTAWERTLAQGSAPRAAASPVSRQRARRYPAF